MRTLLDPALRIRSVLRLESERSQLHGSRLLWRNTLLNFVSGNSTTSQQLLHHRHRLEVASTELDEFHLVEQMLEVCWRALFLFPKVGWIVAAILFYNADDLAVVQLSPTLLSVAEWTPKTVI